METHTCPYLFFGQLKIRSSFLTTIVIRKLPELPEPDWKNYGQSVTSTLSLLFSLLLTHALSLSVSELIFLYLRFLCGFYDHDRTVQNERSLCRSFIQVLEPETLRSAFYDLRSLLLVSYCLPKQMETNYSSVGVTLSNGALTCAAEALAALLVSALLRSQLLALNLCGSLPINKAIIKEDPHTACEGEPTDAEEDDGNEEDGDDGDDGDGGFGEGEEDLSSEDGGDFGKNPNDKSNSKKGSEGGAGGAEENGEEEDDEEDDGDDQDDDDDDDEEDDDDNGDGDDGEEDEEEGVEEEEEDEEDEEEDEEALQPPKKRKK